MLTVHVAGKRISDFPLEPPLAASLLAAGGTADACVDEMLTIAADEVRPQRRHVYSEPFGPSS